MVDDFILNEDNFELYAAQAYDIPCLSKEDFYDDLKRIKYIKRLINRFKTGNDLKERLILNHIIMMANVFGVEHTVRILFYKIEEEFWPELKTFMVYLNYMPDKITYIRNHEVYSSDIPINNDIAIYLRQI